jgi:hypothetical protein
MALLGLIPEIPNGVTLRLTPAEARTEAIGKALGLIGTTMGVVGTVMALTANPAVQKQADGAFTQLPKSVQDNKITAAIGASVLGALALAWYIRSSSKKEAKSRYA